MSSENLARDEAPARPLLVDLLRAYEGLLVGVIVIIVGLVASAGVLGPTEFVALLIIPPILMILVMRRGASPRLFRRRATGAALGWAVAWALFPILALTSYYLAYPLGGDNAVFTTLAILDGLVLGLMMYGAERVATWIDARRSAGDA